MAKVIGRDGWAVNERWQGEIQGAGLGTGFSLIFNDFDEIGRGPRLHTHPYSETFVIRSGRALFTVGERKIEASAGQILVVPPHTPHKFENLGPDPAGNDRHPRERDFRHGMAGIAASSRRA